MAGIKTLDGYTLEDIVRAVVAVLQPEQQGNAIESEPREEYVPKDTVKRWSCSKFIVLFLLQSFCLFSFKKIREVLDSTQCFIFMQQ